MRNSANLKFQTSNFIFQNMYVRFLATSQIKQALKFKSSNCGQSTVVCGRLSAIFLPHFHLTGRIADNHISEFKNLSIRTHLEFLFQLIYRVAERGVRFHDIVHSLHCVNHCTVIASPKMVSN